LPHLDEDVTFKPDRKIQGEGQKWKGALQRRLLFWIPDGSCVLTYTNLRPGSEINSLHN